MSQTSSFFNFYKHGFIRAGVAIPTVRVADPQYNASEILSLWKEAAEEECALVVFPELGLSGYSCEDLFHQEALLQESLAALAWLKEKTRELPTVAVVGLPLRVDQSLFNCAVVLSQGNILGIVPKTYLPNYREFYEVRHFASADTALTTEVNLCGQEHIPFGPGLLFACREYPQFLFAVEICEDLWVPLPPSTLATLAGATVIVNLSASNYTVGKDDYRRLLVSSQSAKCICAYLYAAAGFGESTTDLAWDGQGLIYENGQWLAETERFSYQSQLVTAEIDLDRLVSDRMRQNSFHDCRARYRPFLARYTTRSFSLGLPRSGLLPLRRIYGRFPYVPTEAARRDERCREVFQIQVQGLAKRLTATGIQKVVIGVSGGLDSAHALVVCARTMDVLGFPRKNVLAFTMPGFATSKRTLAQARKLMDALGVDGSELDIRPSCQQMLKDLGHPAARGEPRFDTTFENVQAGERTSHLFRLANWHGGLVVGTSDLSELAVGWCTYGVGDHMAHYQVNASVPKTLIQYLLRWIASTRQLGGEVSSVLQDILETEISPELVPGDHPDEPGQKTEEVIGPYELVDFFLYYTLRFGYDPAKVAFLAWSAWRDPDQGQWPDVPPQRRRAYRMEEIRKWLGVFLWRFFKLSQYKRSCLPNSPKVGSGGSLSPRGDYRAPSDSEATPWIARWESIPREDPL
ncbi:NAD(+) synthase [Candidatus Methylacidithermus pantelleriae]|uniref:Glutamine-dependent NAD(+) synthetase n=1 Tax=Candidatus Methylacidithermus pantelleriae TaxID=2744239 RepID=A0A8J2BFF3_9BACT|nr:NAD(+) synthase [Candidatus Methylacidithermus pantelleriae]CAF0688884.1 Glutamine-dependent NAD(+) synthetase [Candidatus Methylacidithermus pantelleriae]